MAQKIYMVWFEQEQEGAADIELLIGLFENEEQAKAAIARRKSMPGFVDYPNGFKIYEQELGVEGWADGFIRD